MLLEKNKIAPNPTEMNQETVTHIVSSIGLFQADIAQP